MIPTTVSSSPSTATASSNSSGSCGGTITAAAVAVAAPAIGNSNNNNTNNNNNNSNNSTNNSGQQNSSSITVGLASLILEGRAIADDEFQPQSLRSSSSSTVPDGSAVPSGSCYNWSNVGDISVGVGGSGSGVGLSGAPIGSSALGHRLPPDCQSVQSSVARPSTSRAAATVGGRLINITTNPYAFGCGAMSAAYDRALSPIYIDPYSSSSASSSAESTHQRWAQKLCQLRQASPAASLSSTYEQPVGVEGRHSGDPELVALSISESSTAERGEFEIVRRVLLNHTNVPMAAAASGSAGGAAGSASSSPGSGSDNLLYSLQSLASTCLRSGPSLEMRGGGDNYRYTTTLSPPTIVRGPSYGYRATPPSALRFPSVPGSGSSSSSGIQSPKTTWTPPMNAMTTTSSGHLSTREKFLRQTTTTTTTATSGTSSGRVAMSIGGAASWLHAGTSASATATAATATTKAASTAASSSTYPQQGPHCDQFLRKMGLAKGEAAEAEEHFCDMSYVNITCSRWRAYCLKMEGIIERGEPVCIEVYLGPVGHKILLEQWIITQKEKLPPPTMTLPSLCSAIRSQLYFSQISAWCDLIKKSDKTIYDTGRIIFPRATGAAGDLATPTAAVGTASGTNVTPGTSPTSALNQQLANAALNRRPRLNIFYRIKPFDSTACFNSKPNVHNFPNVNISENCSISVCLKSLPRINGGIPKVGTLSTSAPTTTTTTTTATGETAITTATAATTVASVVMTTGATNGAAASSSNGKSNQDAVCTNGARMNSHAVNNCNGSANGSGHTNTNSDLSNSNGSISVDTACSGRPVNGSMAVARHNTDTDADANAASTSARAAAALQADCDMKKGCAFAANTSSSLASTDTAAGRSGSAASCSFSTSAVAGGASTSNGSSNNGSGSSSSAISDGSKHKCMFFIDEEELLGDEALDEDDNDNDNPSDTANSTCDSNSNTSTSAFSPSVVLSHREKQLLKYRKRMMKRDKKHQRKLFSNASDASCEMGATKGLQRRRQEQRISREGRNACQPMEQGEEEAVMTMGARHSAATANSHHAHIEMISTGTQTSMTCCQQCGSEKALVCLKCLRGAGTHSPVPAQPQNVAPTELDVDEMDDSASSISSSDIIHTPRNKAELLLQAIQRTPKAAKHKKQTQRAANAGAGASGSGSGSDGTAASVNKLQNNNHLATSNGDTGATGNSSAAAVSDGVVTMNGGAGCQVCKRQKTQHNFGERGNAEIVENADLEADDGDDDGDGGKVDEVAQNATNVESMEQQQPQQQIQTQKPIQIQPAALPTESQVMDEESYLTSTKLTPHVTSSTSSTSLPYQLMATNSAAGDCNSNRSCTPPHTSITGNYIDDICCNANSKEAAQFKTPTSSSIGSVTCTYGQGPKSQSSSVAHIQPSFQHQHKQTPKPNLLQISCNYNGGSGAGDGFTMLANSYAASAPSPDQQQSQPQQQPHNALLLRKGLPKVNLTPIFCNPAASIGPSITNSHSSPIPMHGAALDATFTFDTSAIKRSAPLPINHHPLMHSCSASGALATDNNIPVQKSYSAPTLPNSPSLSPRFAKQAAIYKRRSRHLSDRSDRSSLGSDEQFSDEDLESGGMYSPATSPLKQRARIAATFGRQPLLGNLEESLLQKRLMPKVEVMGFKVLLGASGGFCPTQLTIPAAAYFYELHGETLSTPYVCDIRLPRKGYSVPRVGNVQATLLNPMGTVVRMFVIPYDMHDMPPLHQTFIRQRILAEASSNEATQNGVHTQQGNNSGSGSGAAPFLNGFAGDDAKGASNNNNNNTKANYNHSNSNSNSNNNNNNTNNNKYRLSPSGGLHGESNLGHFISAEHMKRLRYSIHLRFQTSRSGRLSLHTDIRLLISRRTDCDTAAAHAKGVLEAPNDLVTDTVMPTNPKYSARPECSSSGSNKI